MPKIVSVQDGVIEESWKPEEAGKKFKEMTDLREQKKASNARDLQHAGERFVKDVFKQVMGIPTSGTGGYSISQEQWDEIFRPKGAV